MYKLHQTTDSLSGFCDRARTFPFVTMDTEFLREKTYYSQICVLQMAIPASDSDSIALFDTLSPKLSLEPLIDLFNDERVVKVLHSARQDLEIFLQMLDVLPTPIFDTQIAAMACGFREHVGYETLVRKVCGNSINHSSKISDWSLRPLTARQLEYAASDVDHLREVYKKLSSQLMKNGRMTWIDEETKHLTERSTYETDPDDAWRRIKRSKSGSPSFQAALCELAKYREIQAQRRNLPRNWIIRDEALVELAGSRPTTQNQLAKSRFLPNSMKSRQIAKDLLSALRRAADREKDLSLPSRPQTQKAQKSTTDLLRVLLSQRSEKLGVAERLIATTQDLEEIGAGSTAAKPLHGWRGPVFGDDALQLLQGNLALTLSNGKVREVRV